MKGDEGSVLVVDDNEVNRDLLASRLQRQRQPIFDFRFSIFDLLHTLGWSLKILDLRFTICEDYYLSQPFNPVLRVARIGAGLAKKWLCDREQADLQKSIEEQEKSERLLGKEETNG
jgi:adenylate cyclase